MAGSTVSTGILPGEMPQSDPKNKKLKPLSRHQQHLRHLKHLAALQRKPNRYKNVPKPNNKAGYTTLPMPTKPTKDSKGKTGNTGPLPPTKTAKIGSLGEKSGGTPVGTQAARLKLLALRSKYTK